MGKDRLFDCCELFWTIGLDDIDVVNDWVLFIVKPDKGHCQEDLKYCLKSLNLSSCNLDRAITCNRDWGCATNTSPLILGFNPKMKKLNKNCSYKPYTLVDNSSNWAW